LLGLEIAPPAADDWDDEVDGAVAIAVADAAATASGVPAGTRRAFCFPPNTLKRLDFEEAAISDALIAVKARCVQLLQRSLCVGAAFRAVCSLRAARMPIMRTPGTIQASGWYLPFVVHGAA